MNYDWLCPKSPLFSASLMCPLCLSFFEKFLNHRGTEDSNRRDCLDFKLPLEFAIVRQSHSNQNVPVSRH